MDNLISDTSAMDPEIVMPEETPPPAFAQQLWLGLPRSWALGVFVAVGTAVMMWGAPACIVGLLLAAILSSVRGTCTNVQKTGASAWLNILHTTASLAALACGIHTTLQFMEGGRLRTWLSAHIAHSSNIFPIAILLFVTILFILGLERSKMLRLALIALVPSTISFMLGLSIYYNPSLLQELYYTPLQLTQVISCTAFFTLVFSGSMEKITGDKKLTLSSFTSVLILLASCLVTIVFLTIITGRENLYAGVLLISALEHNDEKFLGLKAREVGPTKGALAILAVICLSVSLVEVLSVGQRSVAGLGNCILPGQVARDNMWTGTKLLAILITGLVACLLIPFNSLSMLLMVCSASYLASNAIDLIFTVYQQYQPSYVPKHSGDEFEGGGSYQLLADTTLLVESEDSESELSDDSGHSSDTDIDAVVHEYKETIKVVTPRIVPVPVPEPTVKSARHATIGLMGCVLSSGGLGRFIMNEYTYLSLFCAIGILFFIGMISRQPQQDPDSPRSPWKLCLILCFDVILLMPLFKIWNFLLIWSLIGMVLWMFTKRRQWFGWQRARLRSRIERIKQDVSPHHVSTLFFMPNYRKMAFVDTTPISQ